MKLAFITQDFPPALGGIQTYSYELSRRLAPKCDYFELFAPSHEGDDLFDRQCDFPVTRVPVSDSLLSAGLFFDFPALAFRKKFDVAFHAQWQTLLPSVVATGGGYPQKIFVAAHARELLFNPFGPHSFLGKKYQIFEQKMLNKVDRFYPVSHYTAGLLQDMGFSEHQMSVIPNGTDPGKFHPTDPSALTHRLQIDDRKVILTITRLVYRKGIDTVIRSMKQIVKQNPDTIYLIAGGGEDEHRLKKLVDELELNYWIKFVGRVPDEELLLYYNVCDVFVMPSKTTPPNVEGFGIVFLEANACGKPVVGSYSGGIPDAIVDEETGIMVPEDNPDELAGALLTFLNDNELAQKVGAKGRDRVLSELNWDVIADRLYKSMSTRL